MAQFRIGFHVQGLSPGSGSLAFPVEALDSQMIEIDGLEVKTFRFTVQNTLEVAVTIDIDYTQNVNSSGENRPSGRCDCRGRWARSGLSDVEKLDVSFESNPLELQPGETKTVTATITPREPLLESDLIDVSVVGKQRL